jgi:serine/threonine protein kinase
VRLPPRYVPTGKKFSGGGTSDVIICDDGHLDRTVVVKALKPGVDQRRLLDELAALQAIRSKHVVQIYDIIRDESDTITAIVEEYLPGEDLTRSSVPATVDDFLAMLYPIAEGIADIHAHGRVHHDIKRGNMKYDAEGCLKIFDFGLSRDASKNASTLGLIGTRGFMAPELFRPGADGRVSFTPAVDVYAFGATCLAIARGRIPSDLMQVPPSLPSPSVDFSKLALGLPSEPFWDTEQVLRHSARIATSNGRCCKARRTSSVAWTAPRSPRERGQNIFAR